jgi:hypothetical protein
VAWLGSLAPLWKAGEEVCGEGFAKDMPCRQEVGARLGEDARIRGCLVQGCCPPLGARRVDVFAVFPGVEG